MGLGPTARAGQQQQVLEEEEQEQERQRQRQGQILSRSAVYNLALIAVRRGKARVRERVRPCALGCRKNMELGRARIINEWRRYRERVAISLKGREMAGDAVTANHLASPRDTTFTCCGMSCTEMAAGRRRGRRRRRRRACVRACMPGLSLSLCAVLVLG